MLLHFLPSGVLARTVLVFLSMWGVTAFSSGASARLKTPGEIQRRTFDQDVKPNWIGGSDKFWYRYRTSQAVRYWLVDPVTRSKSLMMTEQDVVLKASRLLTGEYEGDATIGDLSLLPGATEMQFRIRGSDFRCAVGACEPRIIGKAAEPEREAQASTSPDGRFIVFVRGHNLFVRDREAAERQLTFDGAQWHSYAVDPAAVHDARKGTPVVWLGPGSSKFYVQRWDMRAVADEHAIDSGELRPALLNWKKALPGDASVQRHELWVIDADTGTRTRIKAERWPDQMIGHADIGGGFGRSSATGIFPIRNDDRQLHFVRIARGYKARELALADTRTGEVRTLISETDPIHIDIRYAEMERVGATGEIIWLTQRNGWKHLALHDRDGRFIRWLTGGAFVVDRILAIDQARKEIYFTAAGREPGENPHQIHTYRVATDGSGLIALDRGNAHHTVDSSSLSPSFSYLVDNHSRADLPSRSVLRDRTGRVVMSLEETDTSALSAAGWRAPTPFEVTAADGKTPLHGAMFKPSDFDPTRRYPMIVDVYPGPGANATFPLDFNPGEFENHAFPQALAERGFIVVQPSNRGSSTFRERRFALFGYGNPRDFPMADLRATVDQLTARHSFVDADRIGISGYSGGGLMSATAILTYPDLFKVAVAGAGNHDQNLYEQNSSEFHFGVPPVGMAASRTFFGTNAQIADRLKGRLLLIHSDQDRDVIIAHSLRLAAALRTAGKPYDMMILPGLSHAATFEDPAYFNAAADYFTRYLVASPEPAPGR